MKNEKTKNLILVLLVVCIVGYVYYTFYLSSEIDKINARKQDYAMIQSSIDNLNKVRATIDNDIQKTKAINAKVDEQIPDIYDKKVVILYFYNLIKQYNLTGDKLTFSEPQKSNNSYNTYSVNFGVVGDFENVKDFVKAIENDKRKFNVKQISVGQAGSGGYACNLMVEFYSL